MKITDLSCPSCGAPLPVDAARSLAFCPYCGHRVVVEEDSAKLRLENAYEVGRDFERGRQSVTDRGPNRKLAEELLATRRELETVQSLEQRVSRAKKPVSPIQDGEKPVGSWRPSAGF